MGNEKKFSLSPEEYARIKALPQRKFIISGEQKTGLFDMESNKFYPTDETGELTGKCVTLAHKPKPKPPVTESPSAETPASSTNEGGEEPASDNESPEDGKKKKRVKKEKPAKKAGTQDGGASSSAVQKAKPIFIIVAAAIVVFVAWGQLKPLFGGSPQQGTTSQPGQQTGIQSGETVNNQDAHGTNLDSIEVIQAVKDLIPGDVVTPEDIQSATVSAEVFSQITLAGTQIYKWDRSEYLLGKYVTGYVPAGLYLSYNNVAPALTFAANPWSATIEDTALIKVPIDSAAKENALLNYGTILNLEIRKETVNQVAANGQTGNNVPKVDGLNHSTTVEQSVTIDTFTLNGLTVCDVLNANGDSLYNKYCAYNGIPAGEQLPYLRNALKEDESLAATLAPAYIMVRVTSEQAAALGDLTASGTSTKLSLSESIDKTTDAKASFAANARSITDTINEAIEANETEAAEQAAAQEQAAQEALKEQQAQQEANQKG